MDYVFAFVMKSLFLLRIAISYDISCQWFINLFIRMKHWPTELRLRPGLHLRPLIPKFHEPAHKEEGHEQFSMNLAEGVGLTDGEAPERVWSGHNSLANSTKPMGPGTMHDVYDDNFGAWNWLKYTNLGGFLSLLLFLYPYMLTTPCVVVGVTLIRRYKTAVSERNKQAEAHRGFTESLPPGLIDEWEQMCVDWDTDGFPKTVPSPYKTANSSKCAAYIHPSILTSLR